jgi:probable F420-dependent oxidoreductase
VKLGVKLPTSGPFTSPENVLRIAQAADRCGYDSVWVHDHLTRSPDDAEHHFVGGSWESWQRPIVPDVLEAVSTLAWVAGQTTRVALGTSVVIMPARNPVWLAKEYASLDQLSGGRAILGVGPGGSAYVSRELRAGGLFEPPERPGAQTNEALAVMRGVWAEPKFNFTGEFYSVEDAEVYPKPVKGTIPVWLGVRGPIGRKRVATKYDGWLPMYLSPDEIAQGRAEIRELAEAAGRDPDTVEIASEHWLALDQDRERAFTRSERTRKGLVEYSKAQPTTGAHYAKFHHSDRSDTCNFIGDAELVTERIEAYRAAGVDHLIVRVIGDSVDQMVESVEWFRSLVG